MSQRLKNQKALFVVFQNSGGEFPPEKLWSLSHYFVFRNLRKL